jgi:hypothetical protein
MVLRSIQRENFNPISVVVKEMIQQKGTSVDSLPARSKDGSIRYQLNIHAGGWFW